MLLLVVVLVLSLLVQVLFLQVVELQLEPEVAVEAPLCQLEEQVAGEEEVLALSMMLAAVRVPEVDDSGSLQQLVVE